MNASGAEVDEADERFGSVEAVAAVADQPDLGVESLEPRVAESEADGGEDPVAVLADGPGELDERLELRARRPRQPRFEVFGRLGGIGEVVEQPELFFEQERAVEPLVGGGDLGESARAGSRSGARVP